MKSTFFVRVLCMTLLLMSGLAERVDAKPPKPFDETEFERFIAGYPALSDWLVQKSLHQGSEGNPWIMSGMRYDQEFRKKLKEQGWEAERFFYLLDHINMGLLTSQAEAKRDAARAVVDQRRKEMHDRMAAGREKLHEQMREQMRSSTETARQQWASQRERIAGNPYLPPGQKRQVLTQMDRSKPVFEAQEGLAATPEARRAQRERRQRDWMAAQKRSIMHAPGLSPQQRQAMVRQMAWAEVAARAAAAQRAQQGAQQGAQQRASQHRTVRDPAEMRAQQQAQQLQWMQARMRAVQQDPTIHPWQKQRMLGQMNRSMVFMKQQFEAAGALIPAPETDLITKNRHKLMKLFFPDL